MKILETERLILRPFTQEDITAVHTYASDPGVTTYMIWGPNTLADTQNFINFAIAEANKTPCTNYQYAAVLKEGNQLIGACNLYQDTQTTAEIGWILNPAHQRQGYGLEMGKALLDQGFNQLDLHRIYALCDVDNTPSFSLMKKLGMRKEARFCDSRIARNNNARPFNDEYQYAILKSDYDMEKEIAYYNSLSFEFMDFIEVPQLTNGDIYLVCTNKSPALPEKHWKPAYWFAICKGAEKIGNISLRIGYGGGEHNDNLYYGGHIGYDVNEPHRGNGYAAEACKLLAPIAKAHKMQKIIITNNITNTSSRRVCEKLGLKHIRTARLPKYNDLYKEGQRFSNIFEWEV